MLRSVGKMGEQNSATHRGLRGFYVMLARLSSRQFTIAWYILRFSESLMNENFS